MSISYDIFTEAFLSKITEFEFVNMDDFSRTTTVDDYMKRSISAFKNICQYDLSSTGDDIIREFDIDILDEDIDEIVDIISEGMVVQWLKPFIYRQESLENALNTKDFTTYSYSELLKSIKSLYSSAQRDYTNMMREYSYNHGDLTDLHL